MKNIISNALSAKFNLNLLPGNQTLSYSFGGNNDNLGTSNSTHIAVAKATKISLSNVLAGATSLKNYLNKESNEQLAYYDNLFMSSKPNIIENNVPLEKILGLNDVIFGMERLK